MCKTGLETIENHFQTLISMLNGILTTNSNSNWHEIMQKDHMAA